MAPKLLFCMYTDIVNQPPTYQKETLLMPTITVVTLAIRMLVPGVTPLIQANGGTPVMFPSV